MSCTWTHCASYGGRSGSGLAQPSHVYVPTKSTAATKVILVPVAAVLVLLEVFQGLNLGRLLQRCNFAFHAAIKRDFSFSSLVTWSLGLSCGFSPISACVLPTGFCSKACQSTQAYQAGRSWNEGGDQSKQGAWTGGCWCSDWNT